MPAPLSLFIILRSNESLRVFHKALHSFFSVPLLPRISCGSPIQACVRLLILSSGSTIKWIKLRLAGDLRILSLQAYPYFIYSRSLPTRQVRRQKLKADYTLQLSKGIQERIRSSPLHRWARVRPFGGGRISGNI
jgi:hypothetical protein